MWNKLNSIFFLLLLIYFNICFCLVNDELVWCDVGNEWVGSGYFWFNYLLKGIGIFSVRIIYFYSYSER